MICTLNIIDIEETVFSYLSKTDLTISLYIRNINVNLLVTTINNSITVVSIICWHSLVLNHPLLTIITITA